VLYNALPVYAAMAGIQALVMISIHLLMYKHWSYKNPGSFARPAPI
jgi:hypothetical protein